MRGAAPIFVMILGACRPATSAPPTDGRAAACPVVVRGACVDAEAALRYCGPSAHWDGACVVDPCAPGQIKDEVTGECLGARALRAIAERQHVSLDDDAARPSCREGLVLRVASGRARCDAVPAPIARDRCGVGRAFDGARCVALRAEGVVDAAAWTRVVLGADGGAGSPWLCERIARDPGAFGLVSGASTSVAIDVDVVAPDNDVTLAHARTHAFEVTDAGARRGLSTAGDALVVRAVDAELELFRALGGTSSAGAVTAHVRCPLRAGTAPQGS